MPRIFVSDNGDDKNDGATEYTPIRSWGRCLQLKSGNDQIFILGFGEPTRLRLIADVEKREKKKKRKKG
jgi:hypothetical protein